MPIYKLWSKPVLRAAQLTLAHSSWSRSLGRGEETFQFVSYLCFQSYFVENFIPLWYPIESPRVDSASLKLPTVNL